MQARPKFRPQRKGGAELDRRIRRMLEDGAERLVVASELGLTRATLYQRITRMRRRGFEVPYAVRPRNPVQKGPQESASYATPSIM